ncbi:MAG: CHASE3 domain-containing protein [Verrucomicrobiota bacterium]
MKWNIGTKIAAGFALALIALLFVGFISYRNSTALIDSATTVAHTHRVLESLELLLSTLKDAETGQRGYVITGQDSYLEPFNAASRQVDQIQQDLVVMTGDDSAQRDAIDQLGPLIQQKFEEMRSTLDARRDPGRGFAAAQEIVMSNKGKDLMDDIRQRVAAIEANENDLLRKRAEENTQNVEQTHTTIVASTLVAAILLALVGFAITRDIAVPLNEISGVAERITRGDLAVTVTANGRSDEVGALTRSFARMSHSLQEMAGTAKQIAAGDLRVRVRPQSGDDVLGNAFAAMVDNLRQSTTQLSEGVNVLASSASEILASTTQVAAGAAETGTAIAQTTSTIEEVKQTAQVSSQKARLVADSAQKVAQVAIGGRKAVDASIEGMRRIQGQMESIAESVVKLSEQSQAIGEIIASVGDLAEQSNLLAVNAAIEAAKAGDQGRGFGVVAQEIKSLADQSKQATAQVRAILGDIQKATTAAVLATEQGSKAVDAGMRQSAEAGESIRTLSESITEAAQAATQIAASSQQQLVGTDQVAMAMENIKQASVQNMAGTRQAETAAHNLHDLGQKLKQLVTIYKI